MYDAVSKTLLNQTHVGGPAVLEVIKDITIVWIYFIEIWAMVNVAGLVTQEVRVNLVAIKYC